MISLRTVNIYDFNPWKDYKPPPPPQPAHRPRPKAYVIPHRQKPSPLRRALNASLALQPPALNASPHEVLQYLAKKTELAERWSKEINRGRRTETSAPSAKHQRQQQQQHQAEEARIATEKAKTFACRRCPEEFSSNTKLHEHVRTKHSKKPKEPSPPPTITAPASPPATPPTTPKKPISWSEIASRPMKPNTPSRLPRPTLKFGLPTPPPSPILQPQESTNHSAKRTSTAAVKPRLTVEDLYHRFHGKPRPSSLTSMQNHLPAAPSSGLHQTRITTYFKPTSSSHGPKTPLAPNRKCADSQASAKSAWNRDLTLSRPCTSQGKSFTNSARFSCHQPTHGRKLYMAEPQHYRKERIV